jgi:hypothetical protein
MFDIFLSVRLNKFNARRIKELVDWFNKHDNDEMEYTESDIVRIAINRLYKEKFGGKKNEK